MKYFQCYSRLGSGPPITYFEAIIKSPVGVAALASLQMWSYSISIRSNAGVLMSIHSSTPLSRFQRRISRLDLSRSDKHHQAHGQRSTMQQLGVFQSAIFQFEGDSEQPTIPALMYVSDTNTRCDSICHRIDCEVELCCQSRSKVHSSADCIRHVSDNARPVGQHILRILRVLAFKVKRGSTRVALHDMLSDLPFDKFCTRER